MSAADDRIARWIKYDDLLRVEQQLFELEDLLERYEGADDDEAPEGLQCIRELCEELCPALAGALAWMIGQLDETDHTHRQRS
jgi:hypothetical protein